MAGPDVRVYIAADVSRLVQGLNTAQASLNAFQAAAGFAALGAGVAITKTLRIAAGDAIAFESAFTGVQKTLDTSGLSAAETARTFALLEDELRQMATDVLPVTFEEIAKVAEAGGQLGIAADDIDEFTDTVIRLGVSTVLSAEEAGIALAKLANVLGLDVGDNIEKLGSTLVELGNNSATFEDEILDVAARIAPVSRLVGLTADETLAFSAAVSELGQGAEAAGNAIGRTFVETDKAVRAGGQELELYAAVAGQTVDEFAESFGVDAAGAMGDFLLGLRGVIETGGDANAILEQLGLDNIRIRNTVLALASNYDNLSDSLRRSGLEWENPNALAQESANRFDDMAQRLQIVENRFREASATLGEDLAPALVAVAELVGNAAVAFVEINEATGGVASAMLLGAVAATTVTGVYLILSNSTGVLAGRMRELAAATLTANSAMAFSGVFVAVSALAYLSQYLLSTKDDANQARDAVNELNLVLDDMGNVRTPDELLDLVDEAREAYQLTLRLRELERARDDVGPGRFGADQRRALQVEIEAVRTLIDEMGTLDEIAGEIEALDLGDALQLQKALEETGDTSTETQLLLKALETQVDKLKQAKVDAAEAADLERDALIELGLASGESASSIKSLSDAMDELLNVTTDLETSRLDLVDGLEALAQAAIDGGTSLDVNTEAGRANRRAMIEAAEDAVELGKAYADQKGDLQGGLAVTAQAIEQLLGLARAAGFSSEEVYRLLESMGLLPAQIRTILTVDPDGAIRGTNEVLAALENVPTQLTVGIVVQGGTNDSQLQSELAAIAANRARAVSGATGAAVFDRVFGRARSGGGGGGGGSAAQETPEQARIRQAQEYFEANLAHLDLLYKIGDIDRAEYLKGLQSRIAQEDKLSQNWVDLWDRRQSLLDEIAGEEADVLAERNKAIEEAQKEAAKLLEEEARAVDSLLAEIEQEAARRAQTIEDAVNQAADTLRSAVTDVGDLLSLFGSVDEVDEDEIVAALEHRIEATEDYLEALAKLRAQGTLPSSLLDQLQTAGPSALSLVEALAGSDQSGIASLLARFNDLASVNVGLGLDSLVGNTLDPSTFTFGETQSLGARIYQIGPSEMSITIDAETLIGDVDSIREMVQAAVEPTFIEFRDYLTETAIAL